MTTTDQGDANIEAKRPDTAGDGPSPDSLPSGAGPQADGDQSDISSGDGSDA